jgi:hypothetical protein
MKKTLKTAIHITLGAVLILVAQNLQSISEPLDAYAQSSLSQYLTPEAFQTQMNQTQSNSLNTTSKIPYALPYDINMYNIVGSMYNGNSIEASLMSNQITTTPLFQDINGDGLADLIYSGPEKIVGDYTFNQNRNQYVLLNNGEGFDLVYFCKRELISARFTGDCAATQ